MFGEVIKEKNVYGHRNINKRIPEVKITIAANNSLCQANRNNLIISVSEKSGFCILFLLKIPILLEVKLMKGDIKETKDTDIPC